MGRSCPICKKSSIKVTKLVKLRGKYNPTSSKRKYPNLQWVKLANGKRIKACVKCIKTMARKGR